MPDKDFDRPSELQPKDPFIEDLNDALGKALVDPAYRRLLLRRPYILNPHITDPRLKEAIGEIKTESLTDFAQMAFLCRTMVQQNPEMSLEEIRKKVGEESERRRQEQQKKENP